MKKIVLLFTLLFTGLSIFAKDYSLYSNPNALVSASEANELINKEKNILVIDTRNKSDFLDGHIPTAQSLYKDVVTDEVSKSSKRNIENLLGGLGIDKNTHIFIYDDDGEESARLWWLLDYYGFEKISLIDGGLTAWKQNNFFVETGEPTKLKRTNFRFVNKPSLEKVASLAQIKWAVGRDDVEVIDTVGAKTQLTPKFNNTTLNTKKVANCNAISWEKSINLKSDKTFKSVEELNEIYKDLKGKKIITYGQKGVTGAHTAFVLTQLLGFKEVKNFDKEISDFLSDEK